VASDGQSLQERRAKARPLQTHRAELACGQIIEGAEAAAQFGVAQAAVAVEPA